MARATKKTIETIARAQRVLSKAQDAVFEAVEGNTTRFRECLDKATQVQRDAYHAASANLARLEQEAVDKGQAWRGTMGQIYFNSN
jgi:hypothetical protein